jgi:protein-S-isoprenylcysteine O-methyltransferase Ste14
MEGAMKSVFGGLLRIGLFLSLLCFWLWMSRLPFSTLADTLIIAGGILLIFPTVWLGRKILVRQPTLPRTVRITTIAHYILVFLFGTAIFRAIFTHSRWSGWTIPIPAAIGQALVVIIGIILALTVINLALKGLGAPFAVALNRKLAVDWMYAWTRNPMALATLAFFLALGIWFQSAYFVLWVLILVTPAWLVFLKVFEERELEIRFRASYLEYKSATPFLFPRRPKKTLFTVKAKRTQRFLNKKNSSRPSRPRPSPTGAGFAVRFFARTYQKESILRKSPLSV